MKLGGLRSSQIIIFILLFASAPPDSGISHVVMRKVTFYRICLKSIPRSREQGANRRPSSSRIWGCFSRVLQKKCQGEPPAIIFSVQACLKLNCPTTKRIQSNIFFCLCLQQQHHWRFLSAVEPGLQEMSANIYSKYSRGKVTHCNLKGLFFTERQKALTKSIYSMYIFRLSIKEMLQGQWCTVVSFLWKYIF